MTEMAQNGIEIMARKHGIILAKTFFHQTEETQLFFNAIINKNHLERLHLNINSNIAETEISKEEAFNVEQYYNLEEYLGQKNSTCNAIIYEIKEQLTENNKSNFDWLLNLWTNSINAEKILVKNSWQKHFKKESENVIDQGELVGLVIISQDQLNKAQNEIEELKKENELLKKEINFPLLPSVKPKKINKTKKPK